MKNHGHLPGRSGRLMKGAFPQSGVLFLFLGLLFLLFSELFGNDYSGMSIVMNLALSALWVWLLAQIAPTYFFKKADASSRSISAEPQSALTEPRPYMVP